VSEGGQVHDRAAIAVKVAKDKATIGQRQDWGFPGREQSQLLYVASEIHAERPEHVGNLFSEVVSQCDVAVAHQTTRIGA
jgi:hypothetical protein